MNTLADKPRFANIPPHSRQPNYHVNVPWMHFTKWMAGMSLTFDLSPDYQRAHVWSLEKKIAYVEYVLRGGYFSRSVYFNCAGWQMATRKSVVELVDGKQRVDAAMGFLCDEVTAFGYKFSEYADPDRIRIHRVNFEVFINDLETRADVLRWYLAINAGGVVHTEDELDRVRGLLRREGESEIAVDPTKPLVTP